MAAYAANPMNATPAYLVMETACGSSRLSACIRNFGVMIMISPRTIIRTKAHRPIMSNMVFTIPFVIYIRVQKQAPDVVTEQITKLRCLYYSTSGTGCKGKDCIIDET